MMRLLDIDLDALVANCHGSTEGAQRVVGDDVEWARAMLGAPAASRWFMDEHRYAYDVWQKRGVRSAEVWHFDAHHDCYGATDHRIWRMSARQGGVMPDCVTSATYLLAAWRRRMIQHIYWVLPSWLSTDFAAKALRREMGPAWRYLDIVPASQVPSESWDIATVCWSRRWIDERYHEDVVGCIPPDVAMAVNRGEDVVPF